MKLAILAAVAAGLTVTAVACDPHTLIGVSPRVAWAAELLPPLCVPTEQVRMGFEQEGAWVAFEGTTKNGNQLQIWANLVGEWAVVVSGGGMSCLSLGGTKFRVTSSTA